MLHPKINCMPKLEGKEFGSYVVTDEEMTILTEIDATRVRSFMNTLRHLLGHKLADEEDKLDYTTREDLHDAEQAQVDKFLEGDAKRELLWGGITVEGIGLAFLGSDTAKEYRKRPEVGVIADPSNDAVIVHPANIWHGNADDGWDSGWSQYSFSTAAWNREGSFSVFKPIEEWSASWNRGYYEISLLNDPHFIYNKDLYAADVLFQQKSVHSGIIATLGNRIIRTFDENRSGFPAYQFNTQIQPGDQVFAMNHVLLDSHTSF